MAPSTSSGFEPAAGFSLEPRPDRVALAKGEYSVASRALGIATYFLSGALAINISQFLGGPLKSINEDWYNAWIAFTKQSFGLLTMTLTQTFAPTKVVVSGDESVRGQLRKSADGNLILDFPERLVLIANHQIYTDWLYLWWIAYCNGMHGRLYIILKESLRKIPILGWGMQLSQFIFLKRNWEEDKPNMAKSLQKLNKPTDPMWLLLFPEGTNLAPSTRERSAAWAKKNNISDCKHTLLPRSTGLQFCMDELKDTVEYLYDITVAYEGVPRGQYAQDIFTLKSGYMEGRPPKSVNMHFRRFAIKDIPLHNDKAFELWLTARWREKDVMIEEYYQTGKMPADYGGVKYKSGKILRGCGHMEVPIQASKWYEFLQIFAPMGILAMILYIFYGDLPQKFFKSINKEALQAGTQDIQQAGARAGKGVKSAGSALGGMSLDDLFEPGKQEETFKAGAMAVQKLITSPNAQTMLNRADFMQAFLTDPQKLVQDTITDKQQNFLQQIAEEEAKRKQSRVSPSAAGAGFVESVPSRLASTAPAPAPKGNFYKHLKAEEQSRTAGSSTTKNANKGTFWQDLKAAEAKKNATTGTFWQDVKAAEDKKNAPPLTKGNLAAKGNFWDALKKEEGGRKGTVVTLSTDSLTAVQTFAPSRTSGAPLKFKNAVSSTPAKKAQSTTTTGNVPKGVNKPKASPSIANTIGPAKKVSTPAPPTKKSPVAASLPATKKPAPSTAGTAKSTASKPPVVKKAIPKAAPSAPSKTPPKPAPKATTPAPPPKPLAPKSSNPTNPVKKSNPPPPSTATSPAKKLASTPQKVAPTTKPTASPTAPKKTPATKPATKQAAKAPPPKIGTANGIAGPKKTKPPTSSVKSAGPPKLKT